MAICGFRADNFSFGLLDGDGMQRVVSVLEEARREACLDTADDDDARAACLEAMTAAGLVAVRDRKVVLEPRGRALLRAFDAAIPVP